MAMVQKFGRPGAVRRRRARCQEETRPQPVEHALAAAREAYRGNLQDSLVAVTVLLSPTGGSPGAHLAKKKRQEMGLIQFQLGPQSIWACNFGEPQNGGSLLFPLRSAKKVFLQRADIPILTLAEIGLTVL